MPNTIEVMTKTGRHKQFIHSFADTVLDPHLELMGEFYTNRFPNNDECSFETFYARPEWSYSVYARSGKSFDKALLAG